MKIIPLTKGLFAVVDDEDFEFLNQWKWQAIMASQKNWYAVRYNGKQRVKMQNQILGTPQKGYVVDHINGLGLDNTRNNLRFSTYAQNAMNQRLSERSKTGYKGVTWRKDKNKFSAQITINGKLKYLGLFKNKEDAAIKYNEMASAYFGEFAKLNQL